MNEYSFLRAEIMAGYEAIRHYESILYTVVVAILALTIGSDFYIGCMIPYVVIISVYHIVNSYKYGICRAASYLYVFWEGEEYNWERRHDKFDRVYSVLQKKEGAWRWGAYSQYYLLSTTCSMFTLIKLLTNTTYTNEYKAWAASAICAFTIIVFFMIYQNSYEYDKERRKMIAEWENLKSTEESNKKNRE